MDTSSPLYFDETDTRASREILGFVAGATCTRMNTVLGMNTVTAFLVLQDTVLQLLREAMQKKAKTSNGFLIDGYPRELEQGARFENEVRGATAITFKITSMTRTNLFCPQTLIAQKRILRVGWRSSP